MELLKTALIIALLTITSAKPMGRRLHQYADKDGAQGWLDRYQMWLSRSSESSSNDDSSESSESHSSESSEEIFITDETTPVVATAAMTTIAAGDGNTLTPEPATVSTDGTPVKETTPLPITMTTPVDVTTPCGVTQCITEEIPTAAPITDTRGDN